MQESIKETKINEDLIIDHYIKVSYAPGKKTSDIPYLNISGRWFQALGYEVGDMVKITIDENNRLIIEKAILG